MKTNIRKWGNSAGTIIPAPMLHAAGIALGDKVNIEAKAGTLLMTLVDEPMTLEDLLADSPKKSFRILEDDQGWVDAKPSGREI
ncbi:MAG: AbrB family transcriptional regulator [Porticoccaceae bacterium]|nr:AbrB family transcriptional regulator [Porticoccaceae bacterium]